MPKRFPQKIDLVDNGDSLTSDNANGMHESSSNSPKLHLLPRAVRARDAPAYLGVDRNRFNREFKPLLRIVVLGHRIRCYDRLDLDEIWETMKVRNGRPGAESSTEKTPWQNAQLESGKKQTAHGQSTKLSSADAFTNALDQLIAKSQNRS